MGICNLLQSFCPHNWHAQVLGDRNHNISGFGVFQQKKFDFLFLSFINPEEPKLLSVQI